MDDELLQTDGNNILVPLTFSDDVEIVNKKNIICIKCLKCTKYYVFPEDKDDYMAHLFLVHRLVIADVEDIALFDDYLNYWQNELDGHDLEEFCTTMLLDQLPDGTPAKNEKYYLLSDILPKDFELRKDLEQKRLESVLSQHQYERTDRTFSKECLYCRDVIKGLRSEYLEHLFNKHFLQLGKPDNLVYVDELLAKIQENFEKLVCLFCEKTFKDRVTLKEHMRKKAHKRINPSNHSYDKYFLIHYRPESNRKESSRKSGPRNRDSWRPPTQNIKTEKIGSSHSEVCDRSERDSVSEFERRFGGHDGEDSDSDWSDWNGEQLPALNCLFCANQEMSFSNLKDHILSKHQLDFEKQLEGLSFYQKIKIVNYVRRQMRLNRCVTCDERFDSRDPLQEHLAAEGHFGVGNQKQWDKPEYFFPTYEDDGLLCVLDDNLKDDSIDDAAVRIISEEPIAKINKDAERLSLEDFNFSEIGI